MAYTIESSGEFTGGRVDDLSAGLWGPGYQMLLAGMWTGSNTLLKLYDLGEGAVFHEEQALDPPIGGNDVALAAPVADRVLFGFKKVPGGKTTYLTWKIGTRAAADSKEAAYQDHDLELTAFHEAAHPLFHGGTFPGSNARARGVQVIGTVKVTMSQKAIHAAAASITGVHKMRLAIWHFEGGGQLRTALGSYPEDVSEPATRVRVVTTAEYLIDGFFKGGDLLTAVRYESQLKLIRWRYDRRNSPATLTRIGEVTVAEEVDDVALTTIRTAEGLAAVTVLQLTSGGLKVVGWKLLADGSLTRWLDAPAEAATSVSCAGVRNSDLVTAVKLSANGHSRLIYWRFPFNGSASGAIVRLADEDSDAVDWVKCLHQPGPSGSQPGHTITLSRLTDNHLRLRRWKVSDS